jgi:hypothetical protein
LKHLEDCPFTTIGLVVDTSPMDGTALDAVYCGVTALNEDLCCLVGDSGSDDVLVTDVIDENISLDMAIESMYESALALLLQVTLVGWTM